MQEYFDLLEVAVGCKESEIKSSYKRLAKRYHPDINPTGEEKFKKISVAYDWLLKNHSTFKPEKYKVPPAAAPPPPSPSPQPQKADRWWSDFARKEPSYTKDRVFKKEIYRDISDVKYDRRENCYIIKLKKSDVTEAGIVTIKLRNKTSHKVAYEKNVVDGSVAIVGLMRYKIKILADDDWTVNPMFDSNWID